MEKLATRSSLFGGTMYSASPSDPEHNHKISESSPELCQNSCCVFERDGGVLAISSPLCRTDSDWVRKSLAMPTVGTNVPGPYMHPNPTEPTNPRMATGVQATSSPGKRFARTSKIWKRPDYDSCDSPVRKPINERRMTREFKCSLSSHGAP